MAKVAIIFCLIFSFTANCSNNVVSPGVDEGALPPVQGKVVDKQSEGARDTLPAQLAHPAAEDFDRYLPLLEYKEVALVVNQTSTAGGEHLVDALLKRGVDVNLIFAPEHGFRGDADAGATISNGSDPQSGLFVKSLYGNNKKPSKEDLAGIDVVIFDIQDVGARFYTYISTLLYVMESAARYDTEVIVLDRPNPNGQLVDGPILDPKFTSFVGIAPIPVAHGLTVGEFAKMVNGEGWLDDGLKVKLTVVPMENYRHDQPYSLPIAPSPNLPNQHSIYLYPHLCFFEGTALSVGRGTMKQFQLYGHPKLRYGDIRFTPTPGPGSASPKLEGELCRGEDLSKLPIEQLAGLTELKLDYLVKAHTDLSAQGITFFTRPDFFDLLAGTDRLRLDIEKGLSPAKIRSSWAEELSAFKSMRKEYLLYP